MRSQKKISELVASNPALAEFGDQIKLEQTREGLQIQLVDAQNRPMFDVGSAIVKPYMRDILREIGGALVDVENRISLAGHTDAMPYGSGDRGYSNWELSADRANASRRELVVGGLPDSKMLRVEGLASSRPLTPDRPQCADQPPHQHPDPDQRSRTSGCCRAVHLTDAGLALKCLRWEDPLPGEAGRRRARGLPDSAQRERLSFPGYRLPAKVTKQ